MNLQSLVVVVLRLEALNLLLGSSILTIQGVYLNFPRSMRVDSTLLGTLSWVVAAAYIACAVLLWFFAVPIAQRLTRGTSPESNLGGLSLVDGYSIAFVGIGLYYSIGHVTSVLTWAYSTFIAAASSPDRFQNYSVSRSPSLSTLVTFIIGLLLVFNGRKLATVLAGKQLTGNPPTGLGDVSNPPSA